MKISPKCQTWVKQTICVTLQGFTAWKIVLFFQFRNATRKLLCNTLITNRMQKHSFYNAKA